MDVDEMLGHLLSIDEYAEFSGRKPITIRKWCRQGDMKAKKLGRDWVIVDDEVSWPEAKEILGSIISVKEFSKNVEKSIEQVKVHLRAGRIANAKKIGRDWVIHISATWPELMTQRKSK